MKSVNCIEIARNIPERIQQSFLNKVRNEYPNLDPDGFFYIGNNLKHTGKKVKKSVKAKKETIVKKPGESNECFAQRLSKVDSKFSKEHKKHEGEIFRPIENVMNHLINGDAYSYEVSNKGSVRVMNGSEGRGSYRNPYLARKQGKDFDYQVHLNKGIDGCCVVKIIVAFAFPDIVKQPFNISDYQSYSQFVRHWGIEHIDGDISNNSAENLKWVARNS